MPSKQSRAVKTLLVAAMMMFVNACVTVEKPANSGGCEWVEPIVLACDDIDTMSIQTLRDIDAFNGAVNRICGYAIPGCRE